MKPTKEQIDEAKRCIESYGSHSGNASNIDLLSAGQILAAAYRAKCEELEKVKEDFTSQAMLTWYCGCGHMNGANLAICAACNRRPGEPR